MWVRRALNGRNWRFPALAVVAILSHPEFQGGDCRISLLADHPELMLTTEVASRINPIATLENQVLNMIGNPVQTG